MVKYEYDSSSFPIKWCEEWKEFDDEHKTDLIHSYVGIQEYKCNLIIDMNCMPNLVSTEVINKLHLPVIEHPHPHEVQWFDDGGQFHVTHQALISFQYKMFSYDALCDVVPMRINHLILGNAWLVSQHAAYIGKPLRFTILVNGQRVHLKSLTPQRVFEDQKFKEKRDAKKSIEVDVVQMEEKLIEMETTVDVEVNAPLVDSTILDLHLQVSDSSNDIIENVFTFDTDVEIDVVTHVPEVVDTISAGLVKKVEDLHAFYIYFDPFVMHCTPFNFFIVDFHSVDIKLYMRMITALFTSLLIRDVVYYVVILRFVWPTIIFDPGGFEDESFRRERE